MQKALTAHLTLARGPRRPQQGLIVCRGSSGQGRSLLGSLPPPFVCPPPPFVCLSVCVCVSAEAREGRFWMTPPFVAFLQQQKDPLSDLF